MGFYTLQFSLNSCNFFGLSRPLGFSLLLLFGLIIVERILAGFRVALHHIERNSGRIERHEHGSPLHFLGKPADVFTTEHLYDLVHAVATARVYHARSAVCIFHSQKLDLEGWDLACRMNWGPFG